MIKLEGARSKWRSQVIDAGMFYEKREFEKQFDYPINGINNLVLTHAHADHIGQTLKLLKEGFCGGIYGTYATADLALKIQILQQVNSIRMNNKRARDLQEKGINIPLEPVLWDYSDFKNLRDNHLMAFEGKNKGEHVQYGYPYEVPITVVNNKNERVTITFYEAGHIPGSAQILLDIEKNGKKFSLLTAFDLGRTDYQIKGHPIANTPIVKAPYTGFPKHIDAIVVEATYGDKIHTPFEEGLECLEEAIKDTAKNNGKLIIPAFSIMRTHMLEYFLYDFYKEGKLPKNMHFYVSSPGADTCGKIILKHHQDLDNEAIKRFVDGKNNFFYFDKLTHHDKVASTKDLLAKGNSLNPYGIIAASGMVEGGRIERIVHQELSDPKNIILLTGYQSPGTRGYMLSQGETKIPFYNEIVIRKAQVRRMHGLSGHADCLETIAHVKNIYDPIKDKGKRNPIRIFVKHGEKESCWKLRDKFIQEGYAPEDVIVMKRGQKYSLFPYGAVV